ncbi:hypothetical protein CTA1_3365 [Colletotrichum tanaceti]|uniref:Uncharacterized protein n=1 Tax=Colletotrichum tanaceti TaxID=1306861 RepID=A0A4U6X2G6_9PEZI|nr:hypothetical protein CTA1_3365 [Colletotrichum tanaceti]
MTESAHVSSHPAVHTNETTARRATTRPIRLENRNRLEETHSKARKRATKTFKADSGKRMGPRGEDRTSFWGKDVEAEGPWVSDCWHNERHITRVAGLRKHGARLGGQLRDGNMRRSDWVRLRAAGHVHSRLCGVSG